MTASVHTAGHWAAGHRTALLVLLVAAVLAAAIAVITVRLVSSAVPAPSAGISQIHQPPADDGACQLTRPGQPC